MVSLQTVSSERGNDDLYRFGFSGGMGINALSIGDLVHYINAGFVVDPADRLSEFSGTVEFFGAVEGFINPSVSVGLEYGYMLNSFSPRGYSGMTEFSYSVQVPSIVAYYVLYGTNYHVKAGGGLGITHIRFEQKLPFDTSTELFRGTGFGGKLHFIGQTPFGDNLYGYIGVDFRFGIVGEINNARGEPLALPERSISMDYISFGLKFGLTYYLH